VSKCPLRVLVVSKRPWDVGWAAEAQVVFQAVIAAISGLTPTMLMTRVRL
jgi:hypothetical protein